MTIPSEDADLAATYMSLARASSGGGQRLGVEAGSTEAVFAPRFGHW